MATLTLGVNNGFCAKLWPEPEVWASLVAETLGLHHVQFSFDLLPPDLPVPGRSDACARVLAAVSEHPLSIDSTFTGMIAYAGSGLAHPDRAMRAHAMRWYRAAVDITSGLGAGSTGGHLGAMSVGAAADPEESASLRRALVDGVRSLARRSAGVGQRCFLWELMPSPLEIPHTPEEAIDLLEEANRGAAIPIRLAFDLGHCCAWDLEEPGDPHEWMERLLPWTAIVHLQQTDGRGDHHWPFSPEHSRAGIIDPRRVVEIARSSPLEQVDLLFELGHAPEASPQQVIDDHRWSIDAWARWV